MRLPRTAAARVALGLGVVAIVALIAAEAEARVGGGGGFSSGRRSSGGGGSYSGGGDGGGELVYLLVRLVIAYPHIGVPLVVAVAIAFAWVERERLRTAGLQSTHVDHATWVDNDRQRMRADAAWEQLVTEDPALSEVVFLDFAQRVYRRGWAAVGHRVTDPPEGPWAPLAPFLTAEAARSLTSLSRGVTGVDDVVVGSMSVSDVYAARGRDLVVVSFTSSRVEHTAKDGAAPTPRNHYTEEAWTFSRASGARSLDPDATLRLGCPSCGAAVQCDAQGACRNCGTPITTGQLQWQVTQVVISVRRAIEPPNLALAGEPIEPSYQVRTLVALDLAAQLRALHGRHQGFDDAAFDARVRTIFHELQHAWDRGAWDLARPYTTDAAWGTLRFWLDRYRKAGLKNHMEDVEVLNTQIARVTMDAWYEAITVRIWASARDWIEDRGGHVVGGNRDMARRFSEYWTFVRAVGSGDAVHDAHQCPSCGAPLDKISAAGVCGYCDSVITTGKFDWVLTRIEQPEVYRA